jgi:ATP-grasp ribosomal peptide maturase
VTVLILADDLDPSVDAMIVELDRRGVPVVRLNTEWFPQRLTLDAEFCSGRWVGTLRTTERHVELAGIRGVWRRSPTTFRFPVELTASERQHAHTEAKLGLGGVLMSLPVRWINSPDHAATAGYKPIQLCTAAAAGLAVPATLITNCAPAVRRFTANREVVTKMLGAPSIHEAGGRRVAYTELLTAQLVADLDGIEHTANQFQQWVSKDHEARVIAVGEKLFSVAIYAHSAAAKVDWRTDYASLSYAVIELPEAVAAGIRQIMRSLHLSYGAFDFVIDGDNQWWFLEINPGGQYGWLEEQAGIPVTSAIADLLTGGCS